VACPLERAEKGRRGAGMKSLSSILCCGAMLALMTPSATGQSVRSLIREGNSHYADEKFSDAEVSYRKALEKESALVQGHFNLGNALHKQGKFDEAVKEYESVLGNAQEKETKAFAHYNIGNSFMHQQKYEDAIKSYIEALKIRPDDKDSKYNLSYALEKLRKQQQQKQEKKQDKNKDNQQNKKDQDQKQKQDEQQQKRQQQQQQQQQQKQMSKSEAERILNMLKNSEKDVQRKLRVRPAGRPHTDKDW
jgi:Ca-activated chloride channel family protein